jgi:hypothetical protein
VDDPRHGLIQKIKVNKPDGNIFFFSLNTIDIDKWSKEYLLCQREIEYGVNAIENADFNTGQLTLRIEGKKLIFFFVSS